MAAKPNATKLFDKLFTLREMLAEAVTFSSEIANEAEHFGGEIARVLTGQIRQTLIPGIQQFTDDASNPASAQSLITFMDSVPLAWTRDGGNAPGAQGQGAPVAQGTQPNPTAPAQQGDGMGLGDVGEPTLGDSLKHESAILRGMSPKNASIREALAAHEVEPDFGDKLDFRKMAETYKKPKTGPQTGEVIGESRIFSQYLEKSAKPEDIKRLDEDMLAGAYKMPTQEEVHSMDNWRTMVERETPLHDLDAGDLAEKWGTTKMAEDGEEAPTGTARMTETMSSTRPMDGDVMADILNFGGDLA
jgi:hypothetical protein